MRKIVFSVLCAGLCLMPTACNDDSGNDGFSTVTFEKAALISDTGGNPNIYDNILWGRALAEVEQGTLFFDGLFYEEKGASFGTYYTDWAGTWDTWGGFVISSNIGKSATADPMDYSNQFYAYADTGSKFAMGYFAGDWAEYATPTIEFDKKVSAVSLMVTNANKTYHYVKVSPKIHVTDDNPGEDIWIDLIIKGYNDSALAGETVVRLAEGESIISNWELVDLTELGTVNRLTFTIDSNDFNNDGLLVPVFFCIDNIILRGPVK